MTDPAQQATPATSRGGRLGLVAFGASVGAAVAAPLVMAVAAFNIGAGAAREIAQEQGVNDFDWSALAPVREWLLLAEISFWAGTVLGLWALIQGIIAVMTDRGRRAGIAAVAVALAGVILFVVALQVFLSAGLAAGSGASG